MFERWIKLFGETCDELSEGPVAGAFGAKATRIAESLEFVRTSMACWSASTTRSMSRHARSPEAFDEMRYP
jgi:hypothetical protein